MRSLPHIVSKAFSDLLSFYIATKTYSNLIVFEQQSNKANTYPCNAISFIPSEVGFSRGLNSKSAVSPNISVWCFLAGVCRHQWRGSLTADVCATPTKKYKDIPHKPTFWIGNAIIALLLLLLFMSDWLVSIFSCVLCVLQRLKDGWW